MDDKLKKICDEVLNYHKLNSDLSIKLMYEINNILKSEKLMQDVINSKEKKDELDGLIYQKNIYNAKSEAASFLFLKINEILKER